MCYLSLSFSYKWFRTFGRFFASCELVVTSCNLGIWHWFRFHNVSRLLVQTSMAPACMLDTLNCATCRKIIKQIEPNQSQKRQVLFRFAKSIGCMTTLMGILIACCLHLFICYPGSGPGSLTVAEHLRSPYPPSWARSHHSMEHTWKHLGCSFWSEIWCSNSDFCTSKDSHLEKKNIRFASSEIKKRKTLFTSEPCIPFFYLRCFSHGRSHKYRVFAAAQGMIKISTKLLEPWGQFVAEQSHEMHTIPWYHHHDSTIVDVNMKELMSCIYIIYLYLAYYSMYSVYVIYLLHPCV